MIIITLLQYRTSLLWRSVFSHGTITK